ncbi:MAG TPA: hypothetical protein VMP01_22760, partial [Pirellulaceae bacterium]|nr:hypothetical protein [Pirellulaceae bacterium]
PAKRSLPLRFSLWTLFIVVAVACVAAAWYGMRKREREALAKVAALAAQIETQQAEINRLRAEIGFLTIGDRTKVHALAQRSLNDYHWRWRVYLPPGKPWRLCQALGRIPRQGFKEIPHASGTIDDGEFTIEAFIGRDVDGQRRLVVATPSIRNSQSLDEAQFQELIKAGFSTTGIGFTRMEVLDPKAPILLLRLRQHEPIPGSPGSFRTSDEPEFGFMLWLE